MSRCNKGIEVTQYRQLKNQGYGKKVLKTESFLYHVFKIFYRIPNKLAGKYDCDGYLL